MGAARGGVGGGLVPKKLPETMAVLELLDSLLMTCCLQEEHSCCRVKWFLCHQTYQLWVILRVSGCVK